MNQGKVGPFFYLNETVVSDSITHDQAESYGVCKTWSSHEDFWKVLGKKHKPYQSVEYFIFPRGRITYNTVKDIFYIYLNPILNTPEIVSQVIQEFDLNGCNYLIDDTDVHYKFYSAEELEDLLMENENQVEE